ncbi:hypothetical protein Vadar_010361 [Vaccinium darrowii]|uniref:Uncharacterized protein n=1 Tax=Vaccinium darrowii TaxID=229202 RepID=A0ACB7XPK9_9ERIC|nr:hypothetical protein Vadar_010361 [Vaccinium darrowii]
MDIHSKDPSHDLSSISKQAEVVVIVVPFPCQSHLNQLLHLSCLISSHNIPIHYATTATHLRQVKLRFNNTTHLQIPKSIFMNSSPLISSRLPPPQIHPPNSPPTSSPHSTPLSTSASP